MQDDTMIDIENCLAVLRGGGVILFPTDTVWGLGCDATNVAAVEKIIQIKNRPPLKGFIVLMADNAQLKNHVATVPAAFFSEAAKRTMPTTFIFEGGKNLANNLLPADGSLAVRIVKDAFCEALLAAFGKPIVSTSANVSGMVTPHFFKQINGRICQLADYVVRYKQAEEVIKQPSAIIKINSVGEVEIIRP